MYPCLQTGAHAFLSAAVGDERGLRLGDERTDAAAEVAESVP